MPARVVIVLNEPGAAQEVARLLPLAVRDVLALSNSMHALDALDHADTVQVLVTGAAFGSGQPNGIALIRIARRRRPGIKAVLIGEPEHTPLMAGLGVFLRSPASPVQIADVVRAILGPKPPAGA